MSDNAGFRATADSIINECCGQMMSVEDYELLESRIVSALEDAARQGRNRKQTVKQRVTDELAGSDLTAQAVGRDDIEYGLHTELPRGQHVANLGRRDRKPLLKPKERK